MKGLRHPLTLTWAGLIAERVVRAFWPLWTLVATVAAVLIMGAHEAFSFEVVWSALILAGLGVLLALLHGVRRFCWPKQAQAMARMDAALPGRPIAALSDVQAIGSNDPASRALWRAHQARMAKRAAGARAVNPDLKLSRRDPFGLRYVALLGLVVSLLFGSIWRVGSVTQMGSSEALLATGPAWEGWIEPPTYTRLPSLYLNDIDTHIRAPEGSRITIRLYGEVGALSVAETVSQRVENLGAATDTDQNFEIVQDGTLLIDGPNGRSWEVSVISDGAPRIELIPEGARTTFDGQMSQPFRAIDDYGVTNGTATFALDLTQVARRFGLVLDPEPRGPIKLDLPMPIAGNRAVFSETLIENLSDHPWAHLPVTLQMQVVDAKGQLGESEVVQLDLPARRFFDPLAAAVIEQRRDLLWSKSNGPRVARVLKAISYKPEEGLFRKQTAYLKMRVILRKLDTLVSHGSLDNDGRDEIAQALWDLAVLLEDGDIGDALERMRIAQERLNQAMKNGASGEDIAQLMQELRDATQDYLRQKSQQAQRENNTDQRGQRPQDMMEMSLQDLQDMMDRIQKLMEEGRFAEAQQALKEFQQMMENMQVAQGNGQNSNSPSQQAMEGLADTLRQQQGLSDQAFRDFQEQFNPGAQSGESQGNQGRNGRQGRGQSHEGQDGQGQSGQPQQGRGSLADRQEALRRELERQRGSLPGMSGEAGQAARNALRRADKAMKGAEGSLRDQDLAEAIDQQSEAMEALRDSMRNMAEAMAQQQQDGQGEAFSQLGNKGSDPLGRTPGRGTQAGSQDNLLQGEDVYRRARELLDEIRRRSGEGGRSDLERNYLQRLLDRF